MTVRYSPGFRKSGGGDLGDSRKFFATKEAAIEWGRNNAPTGTGSIALIARCFSGGRYSHSRVVGGQYI